jgi:hypothetical protein
MMDEKNILKNRELLVKIETDDPINDPVFGLNSIQRYDIQK